MSEINRYQVTDDLNQLLAILPPTIGNQLQERQNLEQLVELVMDLGRLPEARYFQATTYLDHPPITQADLDHTVAQIGNFGGDNRAGIERTLHRISAMRNRQGKIIGLTCRVGRAIYGTVNLIRDLVETGKSMLLLGRPGMGKTTALREIARVLADDLGKRVVIIDTSNEIAGDGDVPHPAIGRARRMQVAKPEFQHQVMIEAVENHMPDVIVIDEIGTELEALAARTIAERGVQLVGTAHGNQLANLIKNPTLSDLIGGIESVTLGDEEMRRRGLPQKSILERRADPTFTMAIEMTERYRWVIHQDVAETIDLLLRGKEFAYQVRSLNQDGVLQITEQTPPVEVVKNSAPKGWRASGRIMPVHGESSNGFANHGKSLNGFQPSPEPNSEYLRLFLHGISPSLVEDAIALQDLPVLITKSLEQADVLLTIRSEVRSQSKVRHLADRYQIPIESVKTPTLANVNRTLRRILQMDQPEHLLTYSADLKSEFKSDLTMFAYGDAEDAGEALEEARVAVEQYVLAKGQVVELLPRPAHIRKVQHQLADFYKLYSDSLGVDPNRRLRIYPPGTYPPGSYPSESL
ncbi:MAG: R3H domain-containing nucleic acid-binding protein [Pseudanabaenaceae cyanobacterium bins.68]|nr:R3H domain-containing nucleic acid-binding protein [Pseudanabaenaceae cyanobacterium bins.68]